MVDFTPFTHLLPLVIVLIGAIVLMLLSPLERFSMANFSLMALGFLGTALIADIYYFGVLYTAFPFKGVFSQMIISDSYSVYFDAILLSGAIVTSLIGAHYFDAKRRFKKEFFSLFLFSVFGSD